MFSAVTVICSKALVFTSELLNIRIIIELLLYIIVASRFNSRLNSQPREGAVTAARQKERTGRKC